MSARRATPILRSVLVLSLTTLVVIQFAAPVWAWGGTGHRVIARLAERHLTDQAKAEIKALLEPGDHRSFTNNPPHLSQFEGSQLSRTCARVYRARTSRLFRPVPRASAA
jgi:hypothetical protein